MVLFRYLFLQTIFPFFMFLVILTFVRSMGLIFQLISLIVEKGVHPEKVGLLLIYILPQTLETTTPFAAGISVMIVMIRISADSEFIAMRAAGISMRVLIFPLITFGVIVTLFTSFLTLWARPKGFSAYEVEKVRILKSQTANKILPRVLNYDFSDKVLYVQEKEGDLLKGVFLADRVMNTNSMAIMSKEGNIEIKAEDQEILVKFRNGTIHLTEEEPEEYQLIHFKNLDYVIELPEISLSGNGSIWGKPTSQLINSPDFDAQHELVLRLTNPLACLAFTIAMITLGITGHRSGKAGAYIYALLLVVIYYILYMGANNLTRENDDISPHILWGPPILISCFGLYNIYKHNNNYDGIIDIIKDKFRKK